MGKISRKERKEEEQRILAEMEQALKEEREKKEQENSDENVKGQGQVCDEMSKMKTESKKKTSLFDSTTPEEIHCKRCKTLMENGVCPTCGFRVYVPMEKGKRDKIRLWVTVVCMAAFLVLFVLLQMRNG